jgi:hypothetical protein
MTRYVTCYRTGFYLFADNTVSLEIGKQYEVADPQPRPELGMIRIIDESEESYLYPAWWFEPEEQDDIL